MELTSSSHAALARRDVTCPTASPACNCETGWSCVATARTRTTCATTTCVKDAVAATDAEGPEVGVIVGPVVAVLVLLSLGLGWWALRRKRARDLRRLKDLEDRARRLETAERETFALAGGSIGRSTTTAAVGEATLTSRQPSASGDGGRSPTFALATLGPLYEDESSRPSTVKAYTAASINLDPAGSQRSAGASHPRGRADPFSDARSVHTTRSAGGLSYISASTNVIPIAYVSSSGSSQASREAATGHSTSGASEVLAPARHAAADADRMSLGSVAPSFSSFSSALWDTPTIERANVVHLSQPTSAATSPLSSRPPSFGTQFSLRGSPGLPAVPPAAHSASAANRSPLAQLPVTRSSLSPARIPSPSAAHRRNPFDDFPRPPTTPVTPSRLLATPPASSPSSPFGGSYRSVSPSPPSSRGADDDDHYSLYSLGPERPPLPALSLPVPIAPLRLRNPAPPRPRPPPEPPAPAARPARPLSPASSVSAVQSATLVHVGREHEGPAKALFRSGSVTKSTARGPFPHPPPPIPAEPPSSAAALAGPRDRSSAQTNYSAATYSVLGDFAFILPPPAGGAGK